MGNNDVLVVSPYFKFSADYVLDYLFASVAKKCFLVKWFGGNEQLSEKEIQQQVKNALSGQPLQSYSAQATFLAQIKSRLHSKKYFESFLADYAGEVIRQGGLNREQSIGEVNTPTINTKTEFISSLDELEQIFPLLQLLSSDVWIQDLAQLGRWLGIWMLTCPESSIIRHKRYEVLLSDYPQEKNPEFLRQGNILFDKTYHLQDRSMSEKQLLWVLMYGGLGLYQWVGTEGDW